MMKITFTELVCVQKDLNTICAFTYIIDGTSGTTEKPEFLYTKMKL